MMDQHTLFMNRCLSLAKMGEGRVAPNPLVGAVLVHENRIIGEGYHEQYGGPHAEVNCIESVEPSDSGLINASTLYVSLEPCAHFGKTPPCADLVISKKIPRVIIGTRDPFSEVNGKGIEKLRLAGVEVLEGVLEEECRAINKRFFTYHQRKRPYIILKWAETADHKIAYTHQGKRLLISNDFSNRMVHKWRSENMAIMIGKHTALADDPSLTTRLWPGKNPVRMVVDPELELPANLKIFDASVPSIIFNYKKHSLEDLKNEWKQAGVHYYQVSNDVNLAIQVSNALFQMGIQSLLVEGGARLLQSFIDDGLWDEAITITNNDLRIGEGLSAPELVNHGLSDEFHLGNDVVRIFLNQSTQS